MNLHENIYRIQLLITEDKGKVIKNMIDKYGLFHTIKLMGKYDPILNTIGHEYFGFEDKIQFIRETVEHLSKKYNTSGISIYELEMSSIPYGTPDSHDLEFHNIEYFGQTYVTVDIYTSDSHRGDYTVDYDDLDEETLDNVFIFMIDALEKFL
jgi:hypothetical protein